MKDNTNRRGVKHTAEAIEKIRQSKLATTKRGK